MSGASPNLSAAHCRLLIKGVRSFSPENKNVIFFQKPLTLIVGRNGAGKTARTRALERLAVARAPRCHRSGCIMQCCAFPYAHGAPRFPRAAALAKPLGPQPPTTLTPRPPHNHRPSSRR